MDRQGGLRSRGLYYIDAMEGLDVEQKREDILQPLKRFAPRVMEEIDDLPKSRPSTEARLRPVSVKKTPKTFEELSTVVKKQICPDPGLTYISYEDQQGLAGVVTSELRSVWKDLSTQPDHPLLSEGDNNQLKKRVVAHVVTASSELYHHYVQKMLVLNTRGVFTAPANSARLRVQLSLDLNRLLNIATIRRHIFSDIHSSAPSDDEDVKRIVKTSAVKRPTFASLVEKSRPAARFQRITKPRREVKDLLRQMPDLDMGRAMALIPDLDIPVSPTPPYTTTPHPDTYTHTHTHSTHTHTLPRSHSEPKLDMNADLLQQLGVTKESRVTSAAPLTHVTTETVEGRRRSSLMTHPNNEGGGGPLSGLTPADDLINLMSKSGSGDVEEDLDEEERMPPLLQASSKYGHVEGRLEMLLTQLRQLEEKEQCLHRKQVAKMTESKNLLEPLYPQPSTVSTNIPNRMPVRANDVRVSERVNVTPLTLNMYQPIYNDLADDIDPAVVKAMDQRLFRGDELKDVYQELVKTLSNEHLIPDNEDILETAAGELDLSNLLSSATLNKKPSERVINKALVRVQGAPQDDDPSPVGRRNGGGGKPAPPPPGPEPVSKASREYASWMNWWRSLINADDYMKFVSMQETDFLGVLFHFYDSDADEDEEVVTEEMLQTQKIHRDKQQQLRSLKTEFSPGVWNVNSVLLGGLGKDPDLEGVVVGEHGGSGVSSGHLTRVFDVSDTVLIPEDDPGRQKGAGRSRSGGRRSGVIHSHVGDTVVSGEQGRMEAVWDILQLTDNDRINLALKYSSDDYYPHLQEALDAWEDVASLIQQRESVLEQLERFERYASDPNRFFERGYRGSSKARLTEARRRSRYYTLLDQFELPVLNAIHTLEGRFSDHVTYQTRPYISKMKLDRTEMLYWLQQQRRKEAVTKEIGVSNDHMFNIHQISLQHVDPSPSL